MSPLVVGIGSSLRGDDAIGLVVADRIAERLPGVDVVRCDGDPALLLETWDGRDLVVVVDAVSSVAAPGSIHRLEVDGTDPRVDHRWHTSHGLGIAEAVALGAALGSLPGRLVLIGVEGASYVPGDPLTPAVEAAVGPAVDTVRRTLATPSDAGPGDALAGRSRA